MLPLKLNLWLLEWHYSDTKNMTTLPHVFYYSSHDLMEQDTVKFPYGAFFSRKLIIIFTHCSFGSAQRCSAVFVIKLKEKKYTCLVVSFVCFFLPLKLNFQFHSSKSKIFQPSLLYLHSCTCGAQRISHVKRSDLSSVDGSFANLKAALNRTSSTWKPDRGTGEHLTEHIARFLLRWKPKLSQAQYFLSPVGGSVKEIFRGLFGSRSIKNINLGFTLNLKAKRIQKNKTPVSKLQ